MDTRQALHELDVNENTLTKEQRTAFDTLGYVVLPGIFTSEQCRRAGEEFDRLSAVEGDSGGQEVHTEPGAPRVSNIFNKTEVYDVCLTCRPLLAAAHYLLGEIKVHGANLREPSPGKGHQNLHVDEGRSFSTDWRVVNGLILFDDMSKENGATRLVPESHLWPLLPRPGQPKPAGLSPQEEARLPEDTRAPYPGEIVVTASAGSVIAINALLWHGGTQNHSGARRRQLHLSYTRRDLPQQLNQRAHLTPGLYDRLSPVLHFLLDIA